MTYVAQRRRPPFAAEDYDFLGRTKWRRVSAYGIEPNGSWPEHASDPDPEQVAICRLWLRMHVVATKTIRPREGSYGWKHVVESWAGEYIANGAFIQAALLEGFRVERQGIGWRADDSLNALFAFRRLRRGETPGPANDTGAA